MNSNIHSEWNDYTRAAFALVAETILEKHPNPLSANKKARLLASLHRCFKPCIEAVCQDFNPHRNLHRKWVTKAFPIATQLKLTDLPHPSTAPISSLLYRDLLNTRMVFWHALRNPERTIPSHVIPSTSDGVTPMVLIENDHLLFAAGPNLIRVLKKENNQFVETHSILSYRNRDLARCVCVDRLAYHKDHVYITDYTHNQLHIYLASSFQDKTSTILLPKMSIPIPQANDQSSSKMVFAGNTCIHFCFEEGQALFIDLTAPHSSPIVDVIRKTTESESSSEDSDDGIEDVRPLPTGDFLITTVNNVCLLVSPRGEVKWKLNQPDTHPVFSVKQRANGEIMLASWDMIKILDSKDGTIKATHQIQEDQMPADCLSDGFLQALIMDDHRIAYLHKNGLAVFNLKSNSKEFEFPNPSDTKQIKMVLMESGKIAVAYEFKQTGRSVTFHVPMKFQYGIRIFDFDQKEPLIRTLCSRMDNCSVNRSSQIELDDIQFLFEKDVFLLNTVPDEEELPAIHLWDLSSLGTPPNKRTALEELDDQNKSKRMRNT